MLTKHWKGLSVAVLALCLWPAVASADYRGGGHYGGGYHGGGGRYSYSRPRSSFGFSIGFSNYYGGYRDAAFGGYYGYGYSLGPRYNSYSYYCDTPRYYRSSYYYDPGCYYYDAPGPRYYRTSYYYDRPYYGGYGRRYYRYCD